MTTRRCFLNILSLLLLDFSLAGSLPLQKVTGVFTPALGHKGAIVGEALCAIESLSWFVYLRTLNLESMVGRWPDLENERMWHFQQTDHSWNYSLRTHCLWQNEPWSGQGPKKEKTTKMQVCWLTVTILNPLDSKCMLCILKLLLHRKKHIPNR